MSAGIAKGTHAARRPIPGVAVAAVTALVSGVSVFANSYGLRSMTSPVAYTTAKNLVAVILLAAVAAISWASRARRADGALANFVRPGRPMGTSWREEGASSSPRRAADWLALAYVGVIGGGLAFVLFFKGLAVSQPAAAAFWRDTMVLWVALLALSVLRERIRWWNVAAIALLIAGQITMTGGIGQLGANRGELYVLASTALWAVEVVVAKRVLRAMSPASLALVRMGIGALALVSYLVVTGAFSPLLHLSATQLGWSVLTGALLALYVATWMTALARARALDVTSVLVASAAVTWLLQVVAGTTSPAATSWGLILIAGGAGLVAWAGLTRKISRREMAAD